MYIVETISRECCQPQDLEPDPMAKVIEGYPLHKRCKYCKMEHVLAAGEKGWHYVTLNRETFELRDESYYEDLKPKPYKFGRSGWSAPPSQYTLGESYFYLNPKDYKIDYKVFTPKDYSYTYSFTGWDGISKTTKKDVVAGVEYECTCTNVTPIEKCECNCPTCVASKEALHKEPSKDVWDMGVKTALEVIQECTLIKKTGQCVFCESLKKKYHLL